MRARRAPSRREPTSPHIELTNEASAAAAVDHLVAGGGRRIAIILGPADRIDGRDRQVGYERALYRNGIEVDTRLVERGDFSIDSGYEAMRRLLAHRPDSVFACNDLMAAGALQAIAEAGLRVPDDIAVIGFDDLPIASRTTPPLSTVGQDVAAIGASAVDLLIKLVTGRRQQRRRRPRRSADRSSFVEIDPTSRRRRLRRRETQPDTRGARGHDLPHPCRRLHVQW